MLVPRSQEGRFANVRNVEHGMRWPLWRGARIYPARTNGAEADGEVVWFWCPDAGTKLRGDEPRDDGGKQARSPGRARISRKPIAQGRPE